MKKLVGILLAAVLFLTMTGSALAEEITLWHTFTEDPEVMEKISAAFTEKYPDISVKLVSMGNEDLRKSIKMALTAGTGPDVFPYDCGPGYMGVLAEAGLVMALDDAAEEYGWHERLAPWGLEAARYKGTLYGIACEYEILVAYYNKAIFAELGVSEPATYDEFVDICRKAVDAGYIGLVLDDMEQWPGYHYESLFYGAFGGPDLVNGVLDLSVKGGWNQPQFADALDALAALVAEGLTSPFPNAIPHADAMRDFYTGAGAIYLTGTWSIDAMYENMEDNVGMFIFPSVSEDIPSVPPVGVGTGYLVNINSSDAAVKFLDFMYDGEGGAKIWMEYAPNILPCDVDTSEMGFNPLFMELIEIADNTDVFNANIDVLMPQNVNDVTMNFMQRIIDNDITGKEAVEIKQIEFEKAIADGIYQ